MNDKKILKIKNSIFNGKEAVRGNSVAIAGRGGIPPRSQQQAVETAAKQKETRRASAWLERGPRGPHRAPTHVHLSCAGSSHWLASSACIDDCASGVRCRFFFYR